MTVYRGAGKLFLSVCAALLAAQPGVQARGGREEHVGDCGRMTGIKQARCVGETLGARGISDSNPTSAQDWPAWGGG